MIDKVIKIYY